MSVWGLLSSITFSSSHGNQGQPFLLLSAFPRTLVKFVYVLTCDVITPKWRLVLGSADRYAGNMAAGSRKCGSVRRKCSLKMARKAGFIRSLHESSRNEMFSRCGSWENVCVCVCVCLYTNTANRICLNTV